MKELLAWRQFEAGRDYNRRIGHYETVATNERFYRGDQWRSVNAGTLPTPVFNFTRRIADFLVSQLADTNITFSYSDENLPLIRDEEEKERISEAVALLNRHAANKWDKNHLDRLIHQALCDAVLSGDGIFFTWWNPSIQTGQDYTGDFVTETIDSTNLFVADVNSSDIQSQEYVILSGRQSVHTLRAEVSNAGDAEKIVADGDLHYGAGDNAAYENLDPSSEKATFILKFTRDKNGCVVCEKSTKYCVIRTIQTGLHCYPIALFHWIPVKCSYHGASPITSMIQNQKYVNKAYSLTMKHMIDTAFSKVIYDKTRIPEWTNEVGQAIGVIGGDLEGAASTLPPGEMQDGFTDLISSVIVNTKDALGATEASLGETSPTNTSAIVALQEANAQTLEIVRSSLYRALEELATIWVDFICAYYADGRMLSDGTSAIPIDCQLLRNTLISVRVDVGEAIKYSNVSAVNILDKLLDGGHITLKQYLERLPDGLLPGRENLIREVSDNVV